MSEWIIDTMVSMTLLMALILFLRKPVSHFFGAHITYLLWALPLARLFMPTLTLEAPAPAAAAPAPMADTLAAPSIASDFALSVPVQQEATGVLASIDWLMVAVIIWLGGAGILFISKLAAYFQFREDIVSDGQLVGKHDTIRILETAAVNGPLAFGLFKKYIAVPTDFFRNYAPRERELALDHEIAHHESGDLAANFVGLLVLSLHWFNPVAWFAWIAFRQDQETACDARILQQGGQNDGRQNLRAVYGRTIAKSASGHRLGLASPLNQKDKIKGRLKMLGQTEKSAFRKRIGAFLIGVGTVVALPLTATVSYAEADVADEAAAHDPTDSGEEATHVEKRVKVIKGKDGKKTKTVEIRKYKAGSGDQSARDFDREETNDGFVRKIERDGKTIVLRTDRELSDEEVEKMIKQAEESRLEADAALNEARGKLRNLDIDVDSKEIRREIRRELKEAEKEIEEAHRELKREMKRERREMKRERRQSKRKTYKTQHEARSAAWREAHDARSAKHKADHDASWKKRNAAHKARRQTSSNWSIANQISEISFAPRAPQSPRALTPTKTTLFAIRNVNCKAIGEDLPFNSERGVLIERAWAAVVDCSGYEPKANRKRLLKMTLEVLEESRTAALACRSSKAIKANKMQIYDREIKHLLRKLARA